MNALKTLGTYAALSLFFAITACSEKPESNSILKPNNNYKGGEVLERVANQSIGDIKKDIELPLSITDQIQVTELKTNTRWRNNNQKTVEWQAKFSNNSDKEVQIDLKLCESDNAAMKSKFGEQDHYYLVDCKNIPLRYNPTATGNEYTTFAESHPWNEAAGKMGRICIKDVGCASRFISK